ncbi:glycosyltransferase [Gracilibacillus suaedae]|uniref:glycosyltransferase n=1 Tax=Gracilibacillus suaedae TaxID=2820273 RepID=UPI001ABE3D3A|nr:glycosyltransferase [Gracilibacillus suaedae]
MKVMIVARGYPTNKYKMNGIFEFDQAKALVKEGIEIIYVAIDIRSVRRWRKWGIEKKKIDGVNIYVLNIPCGNFPKKIQNNIKIWGLKKIYNIIYKEHGKPDLIHSHFITVGYIVSKVFNHSSIPLVMTEHYSLMNQNKLNEYFKKIGLYTYNRMDKVLTVSSYLGDNIASRFKIETEVVPNIVDLSNFNHISNASKKGFAFISVGRLHMDKRMDLLIDAFSLAFKKQPKVKLFIYGDGNERKKLENKIKELNMNSQVKLKGLVDREVIADQMENSHCFVLASKLETFGLAYVEALAKGLPVISTRCGGPEDFITPENGILIEEENIQSLKIAMEYMYKNISEYNSFTISEDIKSNFSPHSIAITLIDIYKKLLS